MTTSKTKPLPLDLIKDAMRQKCQSIADEQTANTTAHAATDGPIESYRINPNPTTRAAALAAISIRDQTASLMQLFPAENVEFFQRQAVQAHLSDEVHGIADSLDAELSEILASYPATRASMVSRIAELGRNALALAGYERAAALDKRNLDEELLSFIEAQTEQCRSAIQYFRNNPTQGSFDKCEGVLGILRHELSSAASSGR